MKAQEIFAKALAQATERNEQRYLHVYADSPDYSKSLKLKIIDVAQEHGYHWQLDCKKLYNRVTKRYFACNNIIPVDLTGIKDLQVKEGRAEKEIVGGAEILRITSKDVDLHDFDSVIAYAKRYGFNVEREALEHNFSMWKSDFKSGYRGAECHVFTPCGCNPLSYEISKLDDQVDWQTTYFA